MASHSFSLGDPSKNSLRRRTASTTGPSSARPAAPSFGAGAPAAPSFGATPIVTSDRGEIDVLGSGGIAAAELDDLSEDEDEDGSGSVPNAFERAGTEQPPSAQAVLDRRRPHQRICPRDHGLRAHDRGVGLKA